MKVSILIPTYNWPDALNLCLRSVFAQTRPPDEIIVGDDGSTDETRRLLQRLACDSPSIFYHVWQPDEGFRLASIRNKMLVASSSDYILLVDGDIVLNRHFVADHLRAARPNTFVQGRRVIVGPEATARTLTEGAAHFHMFSRDIKNRKNTIRSRVLSKLTSVARKRSHRKIRTCNFALWREDAFRVGGFDETYVGWGSEDTDLAIRLIRAGVERRNLRHAAVAFHLHHRLLSRDNASENFRRNQETLQRETNRAVIGLERYVENRSALDITDLTPAKLRGRIENHPRCKAA